MDVRVFSSLPPSYAVPLEAYPTTVVAAAQACERAGCVGALIYTDNRHVDPWVVAQLALAATTTFIPLVATQPAYAHPFTVAKQLSSLALVHGRVPALNLVAGGAVGELAQLGDRTPHDDRYDRLHEFAAIMRDLAAGTTVTARGNHYEVDELQLVPALPPHLTLELFVSGSSPAGRAVADALDATAVEYPDRDEPLPMRAGRQGIRLGIIVRDRHDDAWAAAHQRFPGDDRRGALLHRMTVQTTDSSWYHHMASRPDVEAGSPYWLGPFQRYQTRCPYLVGDEDEVLALLRTYLRPGVDTVLLDIPDGEDDLARNVDLLRRAAAVPSAR